MKTEKRLIILLFFLSKFTIAQMQNNNVVGFACYSSGSSTEKVSYFENLLNQKNIDSVSYYLTSKNSEEKYLSTIIMEKMNSEGKLTLSINQKLIIEQYYSSNDKVSICDGCNFNQKIELNLLLKPNELIKDIHKFFYRKKEKWLEEFCSVE